MKNWWINPWTTYDSVWFISIARDGYQEHTTPFFPLYPLLLKLGGETENGMAIAGFIISNVCFFFALYVLYILTKTDFDEKVAKTTVWLLAFFPTAAFFSAVYTESLFLLLLLLSFYSARREQWGMAGLFGLLAALTRNPGVLIFFALGLEYIKSANNDWRNFKIPDIIGISLPLFGFVIVQAYFWVIFGNSLAGITSQKFFYRSLGWPWEAVWKDFYNLISLQAIGPVTCTNFFFTVLAFALTIKYRRVIRPSYSVLILGIVLMNLTYQRIIPPYTVATVRYMSTTFPFAQLMAITVNRLSLRPFFSVVAAAQYLFICLLMSYIYGLKGFLG